LRAGQRKAARGYVGRFPSGAFLVVEATDDTSLELLFPAFLTFRRGLWGEGPAIVSEDFVVQDQIGIALPFRYGDVLKWIGGREYMPST